MSFFLATRSVFIQDCDIAMDYIANKEGRFDLQDVFYRYTLEGIGQIALGTNLGERRLHRKK